MQPENYHPEEKQATTPFQDLYILKSHYECTPPPQNMRENFFQGPTFKISQGKCDLPQSDVEAVYQ